MCSIFLLAYLQTTDLIGQTQQVLIQNPPYLKWHIIKSEHFDLFFPSGIEQDAQKTANLLEKRYRHALEAEDFVLRCSHGLRR